MPDPETKPPPGGASSTRCVYQPAWTSRCKRTDTEHGLCPEHRGKRCSGCGAVATRECCATFQFVCGFPLCPSCSHTFEGNTTRSTGHGRPGWLNRSRVEATP